MENYQKILEMEHELEQLPKGTLSYKTICGKKQPYLQWTENGKSKSKYIKKDEREAVFAQIEHRNELRKKLSELRTLTSSVIRETPVYDIERFETHVVRGYGLETMIRSVYGWEKRECFTILEKYLRSEETDRVCLVFGLRRTGKTTLLRQAIAGLGKKEQQKAVYIKIRSTDTMADMNRDLQRLFELGYKYVFVDEVTLMEDFVSSAAMFSDVYAAQGMKIVLSGTDSLGFWFAVNEELYDRAVTVHTTFIPFHEHCRLLGSESIDEYIRFGGTLRVGELNFDDDDVHAEDASFRDDESTRRYIDTAICKNIQHSLKCYQEGTYFRHLYELYEAKELTGAINRIIEDMNHRFLVAVLTDTFKSHDLGTAAEILRKERDPEKRTDILDRVDRKQITERLMRLLDILNREEQSVGITKIHVAEIKEYLHALELIADCPVETVVPDAEPLEYVLFTQPGMRYCQAQALVYALAKDEMFFMLSEYEKKRVSERILEEVRGRMLEDIVLLETIKVKRPYQKVFKLRFAVGEYDMVVYDGKRNTCECYEVKHSTQIVPSQMRYLTDEEKIVQTERRFGNIVRRIVLYRGEDVELENGILYRNVEKYLKGLKGRH